MSRAAGVFQQVRDYFAETMRHPIGFAGILLTSMTGVLLVVLMANQLILGHEGNPYLGMVTFLILPVIFILGLLLMPLGHFLANKAAARKGERGLFPVLDFNSPRMRNRSVIFLVVTLVNLVVLSLAAYGGLEFMDSVSFCGKTCHSVMDPEFTAYGNSPHARVRCVDCHIGPGASWFVKSKLSGTRQLLAVTFKTYHKPIPTPVENLRPSRETCEQCHWPKKFHGSKLVVKTHYREDEANTPVKTVLNLKVGGGEGPGEQPGIHWHVNNKVYYVSDARREKIDYVRVELKDGTVKEFLRPAFSGTLPDSLKSRPERLMDCVDCHNRPTHIYKPAAWALDEAMSRGLIPTDLPYLRREALAALTAQYADKPAALTGIQQHLQEFYKKAYPSLFPERAAALESAVSGVQKVYADNVFPSMNIAWDTYPNHLGHQQSPGCFRCHDEELATKGGETITQGCSTCHIPLAVEEENPAIMKDLFPEE
jgi:hypothetical protein